MDNGHAGACHVLDLGDRYRMYYWGGGSDGRVVLMAESPVDQPNAWKPRGGSLLQRVPDCDWNCDGPSFPYVLPVDDQMWHMYFGAWGRQKEDGKLPNTTGLAISEDEGITWRYHGDAPALSLDRPWDQNGTGSVSVLKVGDEFRMYYTSIGECFPRPEGVRTGHGETIPRIGIGYAVSRDGIHWEKPLDGLMIAPRGQDADPYEYINSKPFVVREETGYRMWYSTFGYAYRVRSLVSEDGLQWIRVPSGPDGDLGVGEGDAFDSVQRCYACGVRHGDGYRLWFTGNNFGGTGMGYAVGRWEE